MNFSDTVFCDICRTYFDNKQDLIVHAIRSVTLRFERHRQLARRRVRRGRAGQQQRVQLRHADALLRRARGEVSGLHPFSDLRGRHGGGQKHLQLRRGQRGLARRCHHKLEAHGGGNALPRNIIENSHTRRWTGRPCLGICRGIENVRPVRRRPRARHRAPARAGRLAELHRPRRARRAAARSPAMSDARDSRVASGSASSPARSAAGAPRASHAPPRSAHTRGSIHVSATAGGAAAAATAGGGGGRRRRPPPGGLVATPARTPAARPAWRTTG